MERRFYLQTLNEQNKKQTEDDEAETVKSTGKNSRTKTISGPGLNN